MKQFLSVEIYWPEPRVPRAERLREAEKNSESQRDSESLRELSESFSGSLREPRELQRGSMHSLGMFFQSFREPERDSESFREPQRASESCNRRH